MREMSVKERRMDQRFQVRWPIYITAADGAMLEETEDVSLGGAFIRCKKPPPPDQKILLTFENHSSTMQFVLAKVAWTNLESQGSSDKPIGMGIQFMQFLSTQHPREKNRE
jgi:Tfp pilus assembly protein PilZ